MIEDIEMVLNSYLKPDGFRTTLVTKFDHNYRHHRRALLKYVPNKNPIMRILGENWIDIGTVEFYKRSDDQEILKATLTDTQANYAWKIKCILEQALRSAKMQGYVSQNARIE